MIRYYLKKISHLLGEACVKGSLGRFLERSPGVLRGAVGEDIQGTNYQRLVLAFWDLDLLHLGDQLFHWPLIQCAQRQGIEVLVIGPTPLDEIYAKMGIAVISKEDIIEQSVIVSKRDMWPQVARLKLRNCYFVGMNYTHLDGELRIASLIQDEVLGVFSGLSQSICGGFDRDAVMNLVDQGGDYGLQKPIFAINHFVASHHFSAMRRTECFVQLAKTKKEEGYALVVLGSTAEAKKQLPYAQYVDLDLRGKLSMMELFSFFKSKHVNGLISFDAFLVHVATLFQKDLVVIGKSTKTMALMQQRFVPFLSGIDSQIECI